MKRKLFIDYILKDKIKIDDLKFFTKNDILIEYIDYIPKIENDIDLYLTSNKENILNNINHIFLNNNNALEKNNFNCINNINEIIKIFEKDIIITWACELQSLAQNTLAYSKNQFDIERAERIREISCEMMSYKHNLSKSTIENVFANEVGYQTPKIENRAVIINNDKILLVKEKVDGKWALPGGYQDVNKSIQENVMKECLEEAGALVIPKKIIALLNYNRHHKSNFPLGMLKVLVLCEYVSHNFSINNETLETNFFGIDELPELSENRTTLEQIKMCFECYYNQDNWNTIFD